MTVRVSVTSPLSIVEREQYLLAPYAMHSADSAGRLHQEDPQSFRGPFQRDRDRVLHTAAFRRLSDKTQVFTGHSDYHRTRLTHTMEVASIARTVGRALRLNEDLIEALALLHDIGHPPFGHAGEDALSDFLAEDGGFSHNRFALTLVEEIEQRYPGFPGINLTYEVRGGQLRRVDKDGQAETPLLEVQVVDLADSITYNAHDVDDAVELGWLELSELLELPILEACHRRVTASFGQITGPVLRRAIVHELINLQVGDLVRTSQQQLAPFAESTSQDVVAAGLRLGITEELAVEKRRLEKYLHARLYRHRDLIRARKAAQSKIQSMAMIYLNDSEKLPEFYRLRAQTHGLRRSIADFIAVMTDHSFLKEYDRVTG